ncbi:hypothetical protein PAMA_020798 [Pampus argenteus]
MNNTVHYTSEPNVAYALVFGSIMVLGLPLNAVSLWILIRRHSLKSSNAVFMVNLMISDLLLVISLPMRVYFYATGIWPLSNMACIWIKMLFRNNLRSSSIFITFISVDRLLAVVYPLRSRHLRTAANAWKSVALVWLLVLVMNIPERLSYSSYTKSFNQSICFNYPQKQEHQSAMVYLQPALTIALLTVNIVSTAMVSYTLRRHLKEAARVNNKVNVMLIFAMNLIMFTVCFLPVSFIGLFIPTIKERVFMLFVCLASINCCLDPLLYYFSLDAFWKK